MSLAGIEPVGFRVKSASDLRTVTIKQSYNRGLMVVNADHSWEVKDSELESQMPPGVHTGRLRWPVTL